MKVISNLFRLLMASLLVLGTPVWAGITYNASVSDCAVIKLSPTQWRAKFTYKIVEDSNIDSWPNVFSMVQPRLNSAGKADPVNTVVLNYSNLQFSKPSIKLGTIYLAQLFFEGNPDPEVIKETSTVSIDFTTDTGGYPALRLLVRFYSYLVPYYIATSGCYSNNEELPPIEEIDPPEPAFQLKSAAWELDTVDTGDLPETTAPGEGYTAAIKNVANNNLCVSYVTAGVKNKNYALSVTNGASQYGGRNLFVMNGPAGSQLPYNLRLISNDGVAGKDFAFPSGSAKYITLSQAASSVEKRSEMCWTPQVNLFRSSQTKGGLHMDTVNFIITPQA
ncbi:hypothetical protein [Serratia aquatilis]|uniref:Fimbrial protein n=1 Tax=Serratia aquatilis TaxID=1737515 RepID=A0ABV6ED41_9GAMM